MHDIDAISCHVFNSLAFQFGFVSSGTWWRSAHHNFDRFTIIHRRVSKGTP